ncbi:hypothetical protein N9R54_00340 [Pelobium sp.]|nr:hypothetical protein [Pelobium sp.]MDA9554656.1 hypothetical protein [Pelobium sp.]
MSKIDFSNIDYQITFIEKLELKITGTTTFSNKIIEAELEKKNGVSYFKLNIVEEAEFQEVEFNLKNTDFELLVNGYITARRNSIEVKKKTSYRYSEGIISDYKHINWNENNDYYFTSYYLNSDSHLLASQFGNKNVLTIRILNRGISLIKDDHHLIIKSIDKLNFDLFSEISYNILVSLGFISGHFIQDEVYIFQSSDILELSNIFKYRKLRSGFKSIYHSMVWNPYGYKHLIGSECADKLYKNKTLVCFDEKSFTRLLELCYNNSQIQYAMVLFNESNSNNLSLLVKNNCFYAVLEVLKKFFHKVNGSLLSKDYSQKGNIQKFKLIFSTVIEIDNDEIQTLEKRNVFLHGDIEGIEDSEMIDLMLKQITLIYKLLLSHIGFEGYIIDHYHIRKFNTEKAFMKIN